MYESSNYEKNNCKGLRKDRVQTLEQSNLLFDAELLPLRERQPLLARHLEELLELGVTQMELFVLGVNSIGDWVSFESIIIDDRLLG
jgi:hypothetical protein